MHQLLEEENECRCSVQLPKKFSDDLIEGKSSKKNLSITCPYLVHLQKLLPALKSTGITLSSSNFSCWLFIMLAKFFDAQATATRCTRSKVIAKMKLWTWDKAGTDLGHLDFLQLQLEPPPPAKNHFTSSLGIMEQDGEEFLQNH